MSSAALRCAAIVVAAAFSALAALRPGLAAGVDQASFERFLEAEIWPAAKAAGVHRPSFEAALSDVRLRLDLPDLVIPGKTDGDTAQHQAEFRAPAAYFAEKTVGAVIRGGRKRLKANGETLAAIEARWGVPGPVVLAVWGRESGFGAAKLPFSAFDVLATKAYLSRRKDMFRDELLAALEIVDKGLAEPSAMRSSWAGALGQPQFMPSSYLKHAVDFDGDGHRDIWSSTPDSLASIAEYLASYGWRRGRPWGFEATVPPGLSCALEGPDRGKRISDWIAMGVRRADGEPFPAAETDKEAFLVMPAGRLGPAFVVTPNFYVLKEYNESDLYALFIAHAADRIAGGDKGFKAAWEAVDPMLRSDVAALQRALEAKGYDVGGADGLPGFRTRRSIGEWQAKNGLDPTCFPSRALVKALR